MVVGTRRRPRVIEARTTATEVVHLFRAHASTILLVGLLSVGYEDCEDANDDLKGKRHDDQCDDRRVESAMIIVT